MTTKFVSTCFLAVALLSGGCKKAQVVPSGIDNSKTEITVLVSEKGAPSYALTEARVVSANYQSSVSSMTIVGKLNNGKSVQLDFSRNPGSTAPNTTTNVLEAYLDGASGTDASGSTTYNTTAKTVDGTFTVTFPTTGTIKGSFTKVQL